MRGWARLCNRPPKDSTRESPRLFEQALKLDPHNVEALVGAALTEVNDYRFYSWMDEKPGKSLRSTDLLAKAIRIDPTNARAYIVRGMIYRCHQAVARQVWKPRKTR